MPNHDRSALLAMILACLTMPWIGCTTPVFWDEVAFGPLERVPTPDAWSHKIAEWQQRQTLSSISRSDPPSTTPSAALGDEPPRPAFQPVRTGLGVRYADFLGAKRESMASGEATPREIGREVVAWVQGQVPEHFQPDPEAFDQWPVFEEFLESQIDDCDGLELLSFNLLREIGFENDEVYRAILYNPSDGRYHMVTLWFEDDQDPWILDPTGVVTHRLPRLSEQQGWLPVRLFTETRERVFRDHSGALGSPPAGRT
jgi:hypothetical protein